MTPCSLSDNPADHASAGGTTPFRGEKNTNWEGGYRVPCVIRWPGVVEPGSIVNEIGSHEDWLPTFVAAAGDPDVKEKLLKGHKPGSKTFKVHLDGSNLMPALSGKTTAWPRDHFLYWTDDGDLAALRYNKWKLVFMEQRGHGLDVWQEPFVTLRFPKLFSLRADPFGRADHEGMGYQQWRFDRVFALVPAQAFVMQWLQSFKDFPPRQKPASFGIDQVMEKLTAGAAAARQ